MSFIQNNSNLSIQLSENIIADDQLAAIKGGTIKTLADWIDDEY